MGAGHSSRKDNIDLNGEVNFDHFQILRAIGKGSFGKVCIVQKRDTGRMYAMKYMNKAACLRRDALPNVMREVEILKGLEHPFLVNLWFTFQDEEDLFVVVDLLLGGDLRYHLQRDVSFREPHVTLYICEVALALDYLRHHHILHRDIKPDNMLLDEEGHVHITDFNIATVLRPGELATSLTGTKPYMAPEVFGCALGECRGYGFPVDWWSLGVAAFELLKGRRPYDIQAGSSVAEVKVMLSEGTPHLPHGLEHGIRDLVSQMLCLDPNHRISSLSQLKHHPYMQHVDFDSVLARKVVPPFLPPKDHLNCDPTYELEEMIIETRPLHKKKKRLAKQNSRKGEVTPQSSTEQEMDEMQSTLQKLYQEFTVYNRERLLEARAAAESANDAPASHTSPAAPTQTPGHKPPKTDPPGAEKEGPTSHRPPGKRKEEPPASDSPDKAKPPNPRPARSPLERKPRCSSIDTGGDHPLSPPSDAPQGAPSAPQDSSHTTRSSWHQSKASSLSSSMDTEKTRVVAHPRQNSRDLAEPAPRGASVTLPKEKDGPPTEKAPALVTPSRGKDGPPIERAPADLPGTADNHQTPSMAERSSDPVSKPPPPIF